MCPLSCESSSDHLLPGFNLHTQGVARTRRLLAAPPSLPAFSATDRGPSPRAKGAIQGSIV